MALLGRHKGPGLDGLTREEKSRRDALNEEVLRRAGESGVAGQGSAAASVLKERLEAEPNQFLWACLLGWQLISLQRYSPAIDAFSQAIQADEKDARGHYGLALANLRAAESKLELGAAATADLTPPGQTVDNLYHEALRRLRRTLELTSERFERRTLQDQVSNVERAVARKAGRL